MAVFLRKKPKYLNKKVRLDGYVFDSKKECERYLQLFAMQKQGLIRELSVHPKFQINVNNQPVCTYQADFSYLMAKNGDKFDFVVEDVKSKATKTDLYRLKKKLMRAVLGIEVKEYE